MDRNNESLRELKKVKLLMLVNLFLLLSLILAFIIPWRNIRLLATDIPNSSYENLQGWKLVFDDEFNSVTLDQAKWNIEDMNPGGYENCCLGYGVQFFLPQALSLRNGKLQIATERQNLGHAYTSGAITTENKFSFLYGRVDIRAKLPKTQGLWPAFWLLPNGSKGIAPYEIDIMELLGKDPTTVYLTNHWGRNSIGESCQGSDFSQAYHVFSIIWSRQSIIWYIDGIERFQISEGISNKAMYLIINTSLGGKWPGNPNSKTILPQYMSIDYVRIYQTTSSNTPLPTIYIPPSV